MNYAYSFTTNKIYNIEKNEPLPKESEADISRKCKNLRNCLLVQSDWTQVADAPVDQAAWATYRQALRDIPEQAGFPNTINWPTEP